MGFQDMPEVVRKAAQRKGGSVRVKKGFAGMEEGKHKQASSIGGRNGSKNKTPEFTQEYPSTTSEAVDAIFGALSE